MLTGDVVMTNIEKSHLKNLDNTLLREFVDLPDIPRDRVSLRCDTVSIEVREDFKQFGVFCDNECASAAGNPNSNFHTM